MYRFGILFCAVVALAKGQTTQVNQCTQNGGELPINTYIAGCDQPPCSLPQLEDAVVNIIFKAPYTMQSMRTLATAYLGGPFGLPYPLGTNAETCNFLTNTYCPVMGGEVVQYVLRMYIQPSFPVGIQPEIEFRIVDDANRPIVCIRVPLRIAEPNSRIADKSEEYQQSPFIRKIFGKI
ncbi:uncharacterized protein LOC113502971 [Trichoplusia ni]|uniref:Uncharacterized protein LOC113502971 n=1 Tax=Trichoplusia ni TaxID=7111 RepID=A0A7E5WIE2_TRINI|nr:uncharacterized protein LOC113502971 [Trichoplusia ni]